MAGSSLMSKLNEGDLLSLCKNLRISLKSYLDKDQPESALFWAEKLVSLSGGAEQDVYWFAHTLHCCGHHHRAAHLLKRHKLTEKYLAGRYLAAKCHFDCKEYESAQELLEPFDLVSQGIENTLVTQLSENTHPDIPSDKVLAGVHLLRGHVYEALANRTLANECYRQALLSDVMCYEAFSCLVNHHMLTAEEETDLLQKLPFSSQYSSEETILVKFLYQNKLKKYDKPGPSPSPPELEQLSNNSDTQVCHAERYYYNCNFTQTYKITSRILKNDPFNENALPLHISVLVEFKKSNELFYLAHRLVDLYPGKALAWYAVGCYYLLVDKNEHARRYFSKATSLDRVFGPAWLAFGHSFASENEHDQAMAAYFTASQIMKGCHLPVLYIGLEYGLTNNTKLAERFFNQALSIAPNDPFVLHEMGVVAFQSNNLDEAERYLRQALAQVEAAGDEIMAERWEPLINNLGHVCRKLRKYDDALEFHQQSLILSPKNASTYAAIGYVYALTGHGTKAVDYFHKALGLRREDTFSTTMLGYVMEQMANEVTPLEDFRMPDRPYADRKLPIPISQKGILSDILDKEDEGVGGDYLQCQSDITDSSLLDQDSTMERSVSMIIDSDDG